MTGRYLTLDESGATVPVPAQGLLAPIAWIEVMVGEARDRRFAPGSVFIGREWELAQLRQGLSAAQAGRGQLFVVSGEAGIAM